MRAYTECRSRYRIGRSAAALGGAPLATASLRLRARVVTAGGAAGTSDGDARFARRREHRRQLKAGPHAGPPRVPQIANCRAAALAFPWRAVASVGADGVAASEGPRAWRAEMQALPLAYQSARAGARELLRLRLPDLTLP